MPWPGKYLDNIGRGAAPRRPGKHSSLKLGLVIRGVEAVRSHSRNITSKQSTDRDSIKLFQGQFRKAYTCSARGKSKMSWATAPNSGRPKLHEVRLARGWTKRATTKETTWKSNTFWGLNASAEGRHEILVIKKAYHWAVTSHRASQQVSYKTLVSSFNYSWFWTPNWTEFTKTECIPSHPWGPRPRQRGVLWNWDFTGHNRSDLWNWKMKPQFIRDQQHLRGRFIGTWRLT